MRTTPGTVLFTDEPLFGVFGLLLAEAGPEPPGPALLEIQLQTVINGVGLRINPFCDP